jgi:hypothetical protein
MVEASLVDRKVDASISLADDLVAKDAPLLAAYWEFPEERDRWVLYLVPSSPQDERRLIEMTSDLLVEHPYRADFSVSDAIVDSRQIDRARALGAYVRVKPFIGRRIETTFTGGHYFESVVPVYLAPHLITNLVA